MCRKKRSDDRPRIPQELHARSCIMITTNQYGTVPRTREGERETETERQRQRKRPTEAVSILIFSDCLKLEDQAQRLILMTGITYEVNASCVEKAASISNDAFVPSPLQPQRLLRWDRRHTPARAVRVLPIVANVLVSHLTQLINVATLDKKNPLTRKRSKCPKTTMIHDTL